MLGKLIKSTAKSPYHREHRQPQRSYRTKSEFPEGRFGRCRTGDQRLLAKRISQTMINNTTSRSSPETHVLIAHAPCELVEAYSKILRIR
jgi:hypothetical protein